jgi:hypothetical protein
VEADDTIAMTRIAVYPFEAVAANSLRGTFV